jgi:hypothetical protein
MEVSVKVILPFSIALLFFSVSPTRATAQALQVPRVEVGGQVGWIGAIGKCFCVLPIVGSRLTVNISQQTAVELSVETLTPTAPRAYGLYFLQFKRTPRRPSNWSGITPFYTVGTGGYYEYDKVPEHRQTRADGSIVIHPAHSTGELSRLNIASVGGGLERGLSRYASIRLEGSGFAVLDNDGFLAYRVFAGVSVPIGGYRANTIK